MVDRRAVIELVFRTQGGRQVRQLKRDASDFERIQRDINEGLRQGFTVEQRRAESMAKLSGQVRRISERYDRGARSTRIWREEQARLNRLVEQGVISQAKFNQILANRQRLLRQQAIQQRNIQAAGVLQGATTLGGGIGRTAAVGRGVIGLGIPFGPAATLAGGIGVGLGASAIVRSSGEYQILQARIQDATRATGDFTAVQQELFETAQRTFTPLDASVTLFQRLATARSDLQLTKDEMLRIVETVQQLGVISGANQQQLRAGLIQLAQAFASNVVRAEEMNSILENIPSVARLIAEQMGVSVGELRIAVTEGEILSKEFADVLKSVEASEEALSRFAGQPRTAARASGQLANEWDRTAEAIDRSLGLTQAWVRTLDTARSVLTGIGNLAREIGPEGRTAELTRLRRGGQGTGARAQQIEAQLRAERSIRGLQATGAPVGGSGGFSLGLALSGVRSAAFERQRRGLVPIGDVQAPPRLELADFERQRQGQQRRVTEQRRQEERELQVATRERAKLDREAFKEWENQMRTMERLRDEFNKNATDDARELWEQQAEAFDDAQMRFEEGQKRMLTGITELGVGFVDAAVQAALFGDSVGEAARQAGRAILSELVSALVRAAALMAITNITGISLGGGGGFGQLFLRGLGLAGTGFSGRTTRPGSLTRVNEGGPELFQQGNNTYLMGGSQPGRIIPNNAIAATVTINNYAGVNVSTRQTTSGTEINIREAAALAERNLTKQVTSGHGAFAKALQNAHGKREIR